MQGKCVKLSQKLQVLPSMKLKLPRIIAYNRHKYVKSMQPARTHRRRRRRGEYQGKLEAR